MTTNTRAVVQLRCHDDQKAAWFEAAGGSKKFSQWARMQLDQACRTPTVDDIMRTGYAPLDVDPPVSPQEPLQAPAKPKRGKTPKSATCALTGHPTGVCLCPRCKSSARR